MPSDTPTDRAALEAHASFLDNYATARGERLHDIAATLRALASRAEPAADVAALVEEAKAPLSREEWIAIMDASNASYRLWSKRATQDARAEDLMEWHRERAIAAAYSARIDRLAAALTAQAERAEAALARAEKAEALLREAGQMLTRCIMYEDDEWREAAHALAAKIKGQA